MSRRQYFTKRPRRRRKPLVRVLRINLRVVLLLQRTRDEMRGRRYGVRKHGLHRVQKDLLRGIRAQNVHSHRRGEHAARMKEEVQMSCAI